MIFININIKIFQLINRLAWADQFDKYDEQIFIIF